MQRSWLWATVLLAGALPAARLQAQEKIRDSVVRITTTQRVPHFVQPWTRLPAREASGTGFVIDGPRILTNAHVVLWASQIYVQGHQSSEKVLAKVLLVAPEVDLAILVVDDASFFEQRPPLALDDALPKPKTTVNVYGYPLGGSEMSVTEGIISRVELGALSSTGVGLRVQIDAALNPGNSGGPAIAGGKCIGVAFSGVAAAENIGYLIAADEVAMFLADAADGKYEGKPRLYEDVQTVENEALRAKLGLPKGMGGVMVRRVRQSSQDYPLHAGDVITQIGPIPIDAAGKVHVSPDLQLPFTYDIPKLARDGKLPLTVFRGGQSLAIELPLPFEDQPLIASLHGGYPRYFIYGPLVFSAATKEFVALLGERNYRALSEVNSPLVLRQTDQVAFPGEELVIVGAPMFAHRIAKGYSQPAGGVVSHVNDVAVKNLAHLVELLRDANSEFVEFKFAGRMNETLVFRRTEMIAATEEILSDNSIRKQASDDLLPLWTPH